MARHDAGLICRGLSAAPGGRTVLRDIDLEIAGGSLTVVVGPSGAGKTTLLRTIAGLIPAERGTVSLDGRDVTDLAPRRRDIGMVFQRPRLFPNLDAADNVSFPLRVQGMDGDRRRERARELLEEVGLTGFADRGIRELSGGEQQRIALARALAKQPRLLMLDEPLAAVDPERREALRRLVRRMQRDLAITTVYVTHDRGEAAELGDELAVLLEGRIVQQGPPRELFERPRSAVVARFMGSTNLLSGEVRDGRLTTPFGPLQVAGPDGPATITFRPQAVELGTSSGRSRPPAPLEARVVETTYLGEAVRVLLEADDHRLDARVSSRAAPSTGSEVRFSVPSERVWRLPEPDQDDSGQDRSGPDEPDQDQLATPGRTR